MQKNKPTVQENFWNGEFGKEYTDRNTRSALEWEKFYIDTWGISKQSINEKLINQLPKDIKILEVGSNTGMQLNCLQQMGFKNLYGIELQNYAVEKSKKFTSGINIIQGSGFDIPFKDDYFDLVCTNGVLIHIHPDDHLKIMSEMVRCSNSYIMGFEYYSPEIVAVNYRGNSGYLWKADYAKVFTTNFQNLNLVKADYYKYLNDENVDYAYLLQKQS
jgi:pseudaminic acid biosynthesis-associated methylase